MSRILVVEDEEHIAQGLRFNLEADGHQVDVDGDGDHALTRLLGDGPPYDAVILDVMLPGRDGFSVVRALREAGEFVPVLMLTARGAPRRRAERLRVRRRRLPAEAVRAGHPAGARARPAAAQPLGARRATGSRTPRASSRSAAASLDLDALELHVGDRKYQLTQMECDLLAYLIRNAGKAVSRKAILEDVWAVHEDTDTRAIDNFIVRLRRYIEDDPAKPQLLLTVRGVGYKMVV